MGNANDKSVEGALHEPSDAGEGQEGVVRRWLQEIELSEKTEENWFKRAKEAIDTYANEERQAKASSEVKAADSEYNILFSNTEVLRPNLYAEKPRPDVGCRHPKPTAIDRVVAKILEQSLTFMLDAYDFDDTMDSAVFDHTVPGRGVTRVKYEPIIDKKTNEEGEEYEQLSYATVRCEHVQYDDFRRGPGKKWTQVPWIAYRHCLTMRQIKDHKDLAKWASKLKYDFTIDGADEGRAKAEPSVYKRIMIWEIWDKQERKILWIAPSYPDSPLHEEEDKLKLEGFFDIPRPLYAINRSTSLVPITEYSMYCDQARELNRVTKRINVLINGLKMRGIYDATIKEMATLLSADDNQMIPAEGSVLAMKNGDLEKAVWILPIEGQAKVLAQLYTQREQLKMVIYDIVGIADIMRGTSDPNETLGAQELKAQTGSVRLRRRQKDVQRYVRDLLRIKAEIIAENYTPELLSLMTGIQLPTAQEKQQAQQQLQQQAAMAQQQPQQEGAQPPQPDPKLMEIASSPSWDEVMEVLRRDLLRGFNVDIETDSTIAADLAKDRQEAVDIVTGIGSFVDSMQGAIQGGVLGMEAATTILRSIIRKSRLGREVEDVIEQEASKPKPPPQPSPQELEMQLKKDELKQKAEFALAELAQKKEMETLKINKDSESKKMMAEAAAKPSTTIQFDAQDKMNEAHEALMQNSAALQQIAQQNVQAQQINNQGIAEAVNAMAQAIQTLVAVTTAPKQIVRDQQGRPIGVQTIMNQGANR